jgi:copper(I)-binding protein
VKPLLSGCVLAVGLALSGCGPAPNSDQGEHAMAGHEAGPAMQASDIVEPLVDDGVMPVIDVRVSWMRPHPNGRDVTAAYFTVYLAEGNVDRLLSARIDGASRVELHGHFMSENGMMQMRPIGPQDVSSAGPMIFTPGGRHLMVHGMTAVAEGELVAGALVFERAGEVPVSFQVRALMPGMPIEE